MPHRHKGDTVSSLIQQPRNTALIMTLKNLVKKAVIWYVEETAQVYGSYDRNNDRTAAPQFNR